MLNLPDQISESIFFTQSVGLSTFHSYTMMLYFSIFNATKFECILTPFLKTGISSDLMGFNSFTLESLEFPFVTVGCNFRRKSFKLIINISFVNISTAFDKGNYLVKFCDFRSNQQRTSSRQNQLPMSFLSIQQRLQGNEL